MSECDDAVGAIRLTVSQALAAIRPDRTFAIAYSGGVDSSVLLDAFVRAAGADRCLAVHVHHGLSKQADRWQHHCEAQSARLGVRFLTANVDLSAYRGMGVEAAARLARYAALRDLANQHGAQILVLGQHADDQAETVLLQMLRGAGLAGLSAMPARRDIPAGRGGDAKASAQEAANAVPSVGLRVANKVADVEVALADTAAAAKTLPLIRPFLSVRRVQLEAYAQAEGLAWIEDESNQDVRFARNALRRDVLPVIEQHFPAYRQTLSRVARHAASAQTLFDDLAQLDFDRCLQPPGKTGLPNAHAACSNCLSRTALQLLSAERLSNLLRFWIRSLGLRAASASRLDEMVVQLHGVRRRDAMVRLRHREQSAFGRLSIQHDGLMLHGYRDNVFWSAVAFAPAKMPLSAPGDVRSGMPACAVDSPHTPGDDPMNAETDVDATVDTTAEALYAGEACWQLPAWRGSLIVSTLGAAEAEKTEVALAQRGLPVSYSTIPATAAHDPLALAPTDVAREDVKRRMRLVLPNTVFAAGRLSARQRRGGERLSLGAGRPSRSLKHLFQEAGVPTWQRDVPLFFLDEALIFVPYLGGSLQAVARGTAGEAAVRDRAIAGAPQHGDQIVLEWLPW